MARVAAWPAFSEARWEPRRLHRIGERPGANGFGYFSRKKSDSRARRVKALYFERAAEASTRSAELMHRIHQHPYMLRIHVRRQAMPEVENVAGVGAIAAACVVAEGAQDFVADRFG